MVTTLDNINIIYHKCILISGDFESVLEAAHNVLREWQDSKPPLHQKWCERISNLNESWENHRSMLLETVLSSKAVPSDQDVCKKCQTNSALIVCHHCPEHTRLCGPCDQGIHHKFPFHDRDIVNNGFFKPVPPTMSTDCHGNWVAVGKQWLKHIIMHDNYPVYFSP